MLLRIIQIIILIAIVKAKRHFPLKRKECKGVVIEATSEYSKCIIYSWPCRTSNDINPQIIIGIAPKEKIIEPGILTYYSNVSAISDYLEPLIEFAKEQVDEQDIQMIPIIFGGTSSMRILESVQQQNILIEVRKKLKKSGFLFETQNWARILRERDQSAYSWISSNYVLDQFQQSNLDSNNHLQKSFTTLSISSFSSMFAKYVINIDSMNEDDVFITKFKNENFKVDIKLYSHLWEGYGILSAVASINELVSQLYGWENGMQNPCYLQGYQKVWDVDTTLTLYGTGNINDCRDLMKIYLNKRNCQEYICGIKGYPITPFTVDDQIYIPNGVDSLIERLGINVKFTWPELSIRLERICGMHWEENISKKDKNYDTECFVGVYIEQLLSYGYGIPRDMALLSGIVNGIRPSWTMGILIDLLAPLYD